MKGINQNVKWFQKHLRTEKLLRTEIDGVTQTVRTGAKTII